jgi:hypothetical protein
MKHILVLVTLLSIISCKNTNPDSAGAKDTKNEESVDLLNINTSANADSTTLRVKLKILRVMKIKKMRT